MINRPVDIERFSDIETNLKSTSLMTLSDYQNTDRVSLGLALDTMNYRSLDFEQFRVIDGMSSFYLDEINAIRLYTHVNKPKSHSMYIRMNKALKSNDRKQVVPYLPYAKILIDGLLKIKSSNNNIVWRGSIHELDEEYSVGQRFVVQSFNSCTDSLEYLQSGALNIKTLFRIECKNGKCISDYLDHSTNKEYILLPGTEFEIVGKEMNSQYVSTIHLKEIKSMFSGKSCNIESIKNVSNRTRQSVDFTIQRETFPSNFNASNGKSTYQNRSLSDFLLAQSRSNSIRLPEYPVTMNDMDLIREAIVSNKFWTTVYMWKTFLEEKYLMVLLSGIKENPRVISLNLDYNRLSDDGASLMADFLQTDYSLRNVYLNSNQIGWNGAQSLANVLKVNTTLTYLELSNNPISDRGIICLADALRENQTLASLNLSQTSMTLVGLKHLADALQLNESLTVLQIAENQIGDAGLELLLDALTFNTTLLTLDLGKNNITQIGGLTIQHFLSQKDTRLLNLYMNDNPLGNLGVEAILSAMHTNRVLEKLKIDGTEIDANLIPDLTEMIVINNRLISLDLSRNSIGDVFIEFLVDAIDKNDTLERLCLNNIQLTDECLPHILEILKITKSLKSIEFVKNQFSKQTREVIERTLHMNHQCSVYFEFTFDS